MSTGKHIFDVVYLLDGLNRVTAAGEGHRDGTGVIEPGTATRNELWNSLSLTGNWGNRKLDVNGDGVFTGEDDRDERGNGDLHRERRGSRHNRRTTVNDVNSSACWAAIVWSSIQIVASVVGTGVAMLAAKAILAKLPGGDLDSAYFVVEPKQLFIVLGVVHCAVLVGVLIVLAVMQYVRQS